MKNIVNGRMKILVIVLTIVAISICFSIGYGRVRLMILGYSIKSLFLDLSIEEKECLITYYCYLDEKDEAREEMLDLLGMMRVNPETASRQLYSIAYLLQSLNCDKLAKQIWENRVEYRTHQSIESTGNSGIDRLRQEEHQLAIIVDYMCLHRTLILMLGHTSDKQERDKVLSEIRSYENRIIEYASISRQNYEKLLSTFPAYAPSILIQDERMREETLKRIGTSTEYSKGDFGCYMELAKIELRRKDYDSALEYIEKAKALLDDNSPYYYTEELGNVILEVKGARLLDEYFTEIRK